MKIRALLVDNDQVYLESTAAILAQAGLEVAKAATLEDAENLLSTAWFHIAIVDLRMRDNRDDKDISGLSLARKEVYRRIPKIILTAYPSYEYVREALGPASEGLPPAIDFIRKQDGPRALLEAVDHACRQHVHINSDLSIHFGEGLSLYSLIGTISSAEVNAKIPYDVAEFEDLVRNLLYDYQEIYIARVLWVNSGKIAIETFAYSGERENQLIITCGSANRLRHEEARYKEAAPQLSQGARMDIAHATQTLHYGAIAWKAASFKIDASESFLQVFRKGSEKVLRTTLDSLFKHALAPWYESSRIEPGTAACSAISRDVTGLSLDRREDFGHRIEAIARTAAAQGLIDIGRPSGRLIFRSRQMEPLDLPDPIPYVFQDGKLPDHPIRLFVGPADLVPGTVLVDQDGQVVFTEFGSLRPVALYHSFVSLEAAIRLQLMEERSFLSLIDFEQALMAFDSLSDRRIARISVEPRCRAALAAITKIREMAAEIGGDDALAYFVALLFFIMRGVWTFDPSRQHPTREILPLVHALMLAGMLCKKISEMAGTIPEISPANHPAPLRVDETNRNVWVSDKEISLTPTEFDLLLYLYQRAGQLCPRSSIIRDVFHFADADAATQVGLLNTNMSRLREKIEPDPTRPVYIVTVRGQGYKLMLRG